MELCKNTLEEYIDQLNGEHSALEDTVGYAKRLEIAFQIVKALRSIHRVHNLIHRDLSLRNVFFGKDDVVKIGDFGLATRFQFVTKVRASPFCLQPLPDPNDKELDDDSFCLDKEITEEPDTSHLTHGLGTPTFASPEQMSDKPYSQKVINGK